jgi:hypothetical protein
MKIAEIVVWSLVFGAFAAAAFTFAMSFIADMKQNDDLICLSVSWLVASLLVGIKLWQDRIKM